MKRALIGLLIVLAIGAGAGAYYIRRSVPEIQVNTSPITRGDIVDTVGASGTLQAVTTVQVGSQVSGNIQYLGADFNSIVRKGQVIARLDPSLFDAQLQQARANLAQTRANLAKSQSDLERSKVQTMTALLASIAGVSLLVGGIGIMNIMLVSVTERTREIGLRMAIGARGRDVLMQFLVEAVVLSVFGGGIGIALGFGLAQGVTLWQGWPTAVSANAVAVAFGFAAMTGVFFGFYPARKAAALDPIDALRFE